MTTTTQPPVQSLPVPHVLDGHYRDHIDKVNGYSEQQVRGIIASKEAEVERLMEILQSWKAAEDYAAKYSHLTEASEEIAGAWEMATQARDAVLNQNQGEPK